MILALALQAASVPSIVPPDAQTIPYIVRSGDTLDRLSRDFLVPERSWRTLLRVAGVRNPRRLPVGRKLMIPREWLRFEPAPARLASYRGSVRLVFSGRSVEPSVGMLVAEGAHIQTAANSFVTLILANRSKIVIPSQSAVTISRLRRITLTGAIDYQVDVRAGRLETKVSPLENPFGRYRIHTPISMTAVRGTEFRVTFQPPSRRAATEVLAGSVALSGRPGSGPTLLETGRGGIVDSSGATRVEKLLAAPELENAAAVQTGETVELSVRQVPGAARYRAVIAADAGFVENLAEEVSETGRFSFRDIPDGNQFVRISAITADELEGLAQSYSITRRLATVRGEARPGEEGYRFRWFGAGSGTRRFRFQLMRGDAAVRPIVDRPGLDQDSLTITNLAPGVYYWRVGLTQFRDGEVVESWTDPEKLTISRSSRRGR